MVYKDDKASLARTYTIEAYRRLYWLSVNKNSYRFEFDRVLIENELNKSGNKNLYTYSNFFCPSKLQTEILDRMFEEEYVTPRGVKHKLKRGDIHGIRPGIVLGSSPHSSLSTFMHKNPNFAEKIKQHLTDEEIKELDEY